MDVLARLVPALADRYHIERLLGAGGTATVYLAGDHKHGRKVAIKLLHPELSAVLGPERFLAEIKTTAALQHPHILPLFDSGSAEGLLYYVMPYVEGETLRRRLVRERQLPVADALRIATEAADALEYAHRHGIVHRDIKPENILLQGDHALVADFGIALAVEQAGGGRITQTGLSLGTPQYMAPEQALGDRLVDSRADIYALGVVTYEMLAGTPPFSGPTPQAVIARQLAEQPPALRVVRPAVSEALEAAIATALAKLPADRPASAAAFAREISGQALGTRLIPSAMTRRRTLSVIAAALAVLLGLAGAYALGRSLGTGTVAATPPSRLAVLAPGLGGTGVAGLHRQLALTRDGGGIVFVTLGRQNSNTLAFQRLDATDPVVIQGGDLILDPLPSPDGRWLAGYRTTLSGAPDQAFRLPLNGGTLSPLPLEVDLRNADWSADGSIWFTKAAATGLFRLAPDGEVTRAFGDRTVGLRLMQVLDREGLALLVRAPYGTASGPLLALDLESGEETTVIELAVVEARYTSGYLVYVAPDATLWAVAFDPSGRRVSGAAAQIGTGVSLTGINVAQLATAANGTVAFIPEEARSLIFADRSGGFRQATRERHNFHAPQFSPDGRRLSVDFTGGDGRDVWILSLGPRTLSRVTFDRDGHDAVWSPDGQYLTYTSFNHGILGVYRVRSSGGAEPESLLTSQSLAYTGVWLPDGSGLVTTGQNLKAGSGADLVLVRNGGRGPITPIVTDPYQTQYPALSSDGHWLAYVSNHSGGQQVFVRSLGDSTNEVQVSRDGGTEPVWGPGGRELFFRGTEEGGLQLMEARLRTSPQLEVVSIRPLFPIDDIAGTVPHSNYAISPDGTTFAMVRRNPATRIVVLQNLPELVRRIREPSPEGR